MVWLGSLVVDLGGSRVSMEPPFGLDLVLISTDDRLRLMESFTLTKKLRKLLTLACLSKNFNAVASVPVPGLKI